MHTLANAELYCLALSNIYADPNFHNLNHCGIVNALTRKGVTPEPPGPDCPLTETTLFQTNPLRLVSFDACLLALLLILCYWLEIKIKVVTLEQQSSAVFNILLCISEPL